MRVIFSIIVAILFAFTIHAQEISEGTVRLVYNEIITAIGNNSPRAPILEIKNTERNPASFNPFKKTITVERKVLEICHSFGADSLNALSYILAHELAHSYCRHGWHTKFATLDFSNQVDKDIEAFEKRVDNETQADIYAAFFSHIAGYNALDVAPDFLEKVYNEYQLPDSIPGYPSFSQRIKIIQNNKQEFLNLKKVYDASIVAFSLGQYDYATKLFDYIINSGFTSRELYNNLGLTFIYRALELIDESNDENFIFPFKLDVDSRLVNQGLKRDLSGKDEAIYFIKLAIDEFQNALRLSPNYFQAKENVYYAELLLYRLGETVEFTFTPDEILDLNQSCEYCVMGCYSSVIEKHSKAIKYFKKGAANNCVLCLNNTNLDQTGLQSYLPNNNSEFEYNGFDIYCKDFTSNECDLYVDTKNNLSICFDNKDAIHTTFIKSKSKGIKSCISLIEVFEGYVSDQVPVKVGDTIEQLKDLSLKYEIFNAGSRVYYNIKSAQISFLVEDNIIKSGYYYERID